jgi:hypothetical protein
MKCQMTIYVETILGSLGKKCNMYTHMVTYMLHFREMKMLMVSCYTLEVCLVIWMQYELLCESLTNMILSACVSLDWNIWIILVKLSKFAFISRDICHTYNHLYVV